VSKKDKRVQRLALRRFFTGVPDTLEQAAETFDRLVWVIGAALVLALVALAGHWLAGGHHHAPPPDDPGDSTLYARDLGRLPDGRHQFDLVLAWQHRGPVAATVVRLSLGDVAVTGDSAELMAAPGPFDDRAASGAVAWHLAQNRVTRDCDHPAPPGLTGACGVREPLAHYRITARPDQLVDVTATLVAPPPPPRWFGHDDPAAARHANRIGEELQLGAVLRAHCPLGVKVHNGSVTPLCGT
jgi:hypothetical protein